MKSGMCIVCQARPVQQCRSMMCVLCGRSYDRALATDTTIAGMIRWAVERARRFERKAQRERVSWRQL